MQIEFTTRGLLSNFFRQGGKCSVLFLTIVLGGATYAFLAKPVYEVGGSVLVKFGRSMSSQISSTDNDGGVISQDDRREIMQSDMDILQSHDLIASVVKDVGAENLYPGITAQVMGKDLPVEVAVRKLAKGDLIIKSGQMSNVIDIKLDNRNPEVAAQFVHKLMEAFIAKQSGIYNNPQTVFLEEQTKQARVKLEASQRALETFKAQKGISSMNGELEELLRQRSDAGTVALEPTDDAWDKLSDLQSEEKRLRMVYRPDSPQVLKAHAAVELAQQQLHMRQAEIHAKSARATGALDKRITQLESQRKQYDDLTRQVEIDERNYKNYEAHSEEARINDKLSRKNITSVSVVDEPVVPLKPAYPRKGLVLILSLLTGIVASIGIALTLEAYDARFTTPEQLAQAVGVPVMATFNARRNRKGRM
ncbi:MAG TPA: GNVR domain-containing protein [Rickettsiales bacterium]|nr:GNVR domain-containing protein [Rickettsiales bacterium]